MMAGEGWRFVRFGLLVTGEGEAQFLPSFLRALSDSGHGTFSVLRRIGQRSPITSPKRVLTMVGAGKRIPDRDEEEIGLPARQWTRQNASHVVLLIDDLEHDRAHLKAQIFARYRAALDNLLGADARRASVHFLVYMLEAYYFADAAAINAALGTGLQDHAGDVEQIRHPKNELKHLRVGFDEIAHGRQIVERMDLDHVLGQPDTCASLRALVRWCWVAMDEVPGARFQLAEGQVDPLTGAQAP